MKLFRNTLSPLLLLLAALPVARAQQERPNILVCISDDQSFPHTSAYGTAWVRTPAFDRVAKEGILFMNAYTPNAKCAPSRSCLLTGRNSWQLEEAANHSPDFPAKFVTYVEALAENGYHTGFTGKGWAPGNAGRRNGKQRELTGPRYSKLTTTPPAKGISNVDYAANFKDFLEQKEEGTPFCFWFGAVEPHRAYEFGVGERLGGKRKADIDRVPGFWPDNDTVRTDLLDYAYEIEYFDSHLERMLAILEEQGELENTIVVVTADNGMPFPRVKGQAYEYSNHLPLAIMWRKGIRNPGRTEEGFVSFIDFAPTFLELAGVRPEAAGMQPIEGKSLKGIFLGQEKGRDAVLIGKERHDIGRPQDQGYPIRGIVSGNYLYVQNFEPSRWPAGNPETGYLNTDGSPTKTLILNQRRHQGLTEFWELAFGKRPGEELYDIRKDPECLLNLAGDPALAGVKSRLRERLFKELRAQHDPRVLGRGEVFDQYPYSEDARRNFYERYMSGEKVETGWVEPSDYEKDFKPEGR